jgi:hypothetical protein
MQPGTDLIRGEATWNALVPHGREYYLSAPSRQGQGVGADAASKLPPESWLSPWRQMGPWEVAWDVDRYNLPRGEEVAGVLIYVVTGEEQVIDAGTP